MNQQNVDMFILKKGNFFPNSSLMMLRERLNKLDDSNLSLLLSANFKDPNIGFLFSIGLGAYGIDRFYLGHTFIGILKLILILSIILTYVPIVFDDDCSPFIFGVFIIQVIGVLLWYIVDIFKVSKEIKEYNFTHLLTLLN